MSTAAPARLDTAGERLAVDSCLPWVEDLIAEGADGELVRTGSVGATVQIGIEASRRAFDTRGWQPLTRGAWRRGGEVVLENVCTSGFDVHVSVARAPVRFTFRWRPPARDRAAARLLRSRWHLLARAVLTQYPALWSASVRGRAPMHASACAGEFGRILVSAASGAGRSTVVLREVRGGACATSDNLGVGDGTSVWGLVEPLRVEGGGGRRMAHGRRETRMDGRTDRLEPETVLVLERGLATEPVVEPCDRMTAARSLVTSTLMAGELRRYWPFAATLSAGTGIGPPQPPLMDVASMFASKLRCLRLVLGTGRRAALSELLGEEVTQTKA